MSKQVTQRHKQRVAPQARAVQVVRSRARAARKELAVLTAQCTRMATLAAAIRVLLPVRLQCNLERYYFTVAIDDWLNGPRAASGARLQTERWYRKKKRQIGGYEWDRAIRLGKDQDRLSPLSGQKYWRACCLPCKRCNTNCPRARPRRAA